MSWLDTYFREIDQTPLLTADQEKQLARRIGAGDSEARDNMVRANLRLVVNIARSYVNKGLSLPDLIEEGNLGLLRAVEGFDPTRETRFSTYASYWIKQSIKRSIVNSAKTIRIPAYMVELLSKWRKTMARLSDELGRTPTQEEVALELEIPRKKLKIVKKAIEMYNATPHAGEQSDKGWSLSEIVPDGRLKGPEDELIENDNVKHIYQMMDDMDPREAEGHTRRIQHQEANGHAEGDGGADEEAVSHPEEE
jgi:RNA polymerase primary sigma factor